MITYSIMSQKGDHEPNEDMAVMAESDGTYCFAVADGLGGHGNGDVASRQVADTVMQLFLEDCAQPDFLAKAFEESQKKLRERQMQEHAENGMKTTLALLTVNGTQMEYGHIGDTRIYYFRKNKLMARTLDHSVPQMLVAAGKIREKEIRHHPDRSRLVRVMGTEWEGTPYEVHKPLKRESGKRQAFLLCTDGFWELIDEKTMTRLLKRSDTAREWLDAMTEVVRRNGEGLTMDNYSAIAVLVT